MMISLFLLLLNYKNCKPYDKMNGEYFKNYISRKFPKLINLRISHRIDFGFKMEIFVKIVMQPKGHITSAVQIYYPYTC